MSRRLTSEIACVYDELGRTLGELRARCGSIYESTHTLESMMTKQVVIGAVVSAIAMFMWGWFYWTVLPMPVGIWKKQTTAEQVALANDLVKHLKEDGVYFLPRPEEGVDDESDPASPFYTRHKEGPLAHIYYQKAGSDPMAPATFAFGFLHVLVANVMLAVLLASMRKSFCCYAARVAFVAGIGLFAGFWIEMSRPIWFHHPLQYAVFSWGYHISVWLIGGLILGAIVKLKADNLASVATE